MPIIDFIYLNVNRRAKKSAELSLKNASRQSECCLAKKFSCTIDIAANLPAERRWFVTTVAADVVAGVALYFIYKWLDKRN